MGVRECESAKVRKWRSAEARDARRIPRTPAPPHLRTRRSGKAKGTLRPGRVPFADHAAGPSCRREGSQGLAHLALAQALERAVAELADALAGDAQDVADLLQRVLAPALQPEVQ